MQNPLLHTRYHMKGRLKIPLYKRAASQSVPSVLRMNFIPHTGEGDLNDNSRK